MTSTAEVHVSSRIRYGWRFYLAPLINLLPMPLRRRAAVAAIRRVRIELRADDAVVARFGVRPTFEPDGALVLHPVTRM